MLVLHTELSGELSFKDLLKRVRHVILEAYAHQDVPFAKLLEVTQAPRDWGRNALFQHSFIFLSDEGAATGFESLEMIPIEYDPHVSRFDMTFVVEDHGDHLDSFIEYNTDLFSEASMARFGAHFEMLLHSFAAHPDRPIAELPMLTEAERQQLLAEWNETQRPYPADVGVHQLFEAQAARTPENIAVVFGEEYLTYWELNARSNQLAHYLRALGVGPEALVGIYMERSVDMVVGLLGILKSGGAYLPLDLSYPPPRIAYMLQDAHVPVLLIQQHLQEQLPDVQQLQQSMQVVCLDTDWATIAACRAANPENQTQPENLAYVMYTSGSTGNPKGVEIPHRAINRLVNNTNYIELTEHDRVAQASNASFDAATFEIWGALLHGAQLIGMSRDVALSPAKLVEQLREQQVSVLFLTTALFNQVVNLEPNAFQTLRYLLFGGEAVDPGAVRQALQAGPPEHFLHVYGPTESTTFSSWHAIDRVAEDATTVPIGMPLANTQLYVLDDYRQPVPIGVLGELYIGGDGLARGYLHRPALTDEGFVPNPFGAGRLYKTGDLVRYRADGNIEFVGRIDNQVKLRGFRIELGEIEATLSQHPAVQETAVVLREDQPGYKRLAAYVVTGEQPQAFSRLIPDFRAHLQQTLPDYMVPAAFVPMPSLPLTPNGKVDQRALPAPDTAAFTPTTEFVLPQTPAEQTLAAIWAELLRVEQLGRHDNFFSGAGTPFSVSRSSAGPIKPGSI